MIFRCPRCSEGMSCPELDDKHFHCSQCGGRYIIEVWDRTKEVQEK